MVRGLPLYLVIIILIILLMNNFGLALGEAFKDNTGQTWPTRTPTPATEPSRQPDPDDPDPPGSNQSGASATPTNSEASPAEDPIIVATTAPENINFIPTASPCGIPPTILVLGSVSVRTGPAIDYPLLGSLAYSEVKIIIGRSEYAPWWLIQYNENQQGWVSDSAVMVHGYTGNTSLATPSTGISNAISEDNEWNPTPHPQCTEDQSINSSQFVESQTPGTPVTNPAANQQSPSPTVVAEVVIDADPTEALTNMEQTEVQVAPVEFSESSSIPLNWLPVVGLFLILAGAALLVFQRWQSKVERD